MKAQEYFKKVYKSSTHNQKISLDNLKAVCDCFEKENLRIRVMAVGRECRRRFAMTSENTIKASKVLKEYINLRAKEQKVVDPVLNLDTAVSERLKYLELENRKLRELLKLKELT